VNDPPRRAIENGGLSNGFSFPSGLPGQAPGLDIRQFQYPTGIYPVYPPSVGKSIRLKAAFLYRLQDDPAMIECQHRKMIDGEKLRPRRVVSGLDGWSIRARSLKELE
jgi:hypothetical protein